MFGCVAVFGIATMVFGESRWMWLSLASLFVLGASDMVSVYVRSSLIQLHTPDAMRGRVSAVSGLFISASNELGEFRAGLAGAAFGPVAAVVGGGALAVARHRHLRLGLPVAQEGRPLRPARSSICSPRRRARISRSTNRPRSPRASTPGRERNSAMKAANILETIGNTPHIRINRLFGRRRGLDQVGARQSRRLDQGPHRARR